MFRVPTCLWAVRHQDQEYEPSVRITLYSTTLLKIALFPPSGHKRRRAGPDPVRRRLPSAGVRPRGLPQEPAPPHLQRRTLLRPRLHAAARRGRQRKRLETR